MGWTLSKNKRYETDRTRLVVASDSLDSPEEEFANSIEYFFFEPETLNSRTPTAYRWLLAQFGSKLRLKSVDAKGCRE